MATGWAKGAGATQAVRATLRIWDPSADDPRPAVAGGAVVHPHAPPSGAPAALWRVGPERSPVELRVWLEWPRGIPEAIRHPSGVWVALRTLG